MESGRCLLIGLILKIQTGNLGWGRCWPTLSFQKVWVEELWAFVASPDCHPPAVCLWDPMCDFISWVCVLCSPLECVSRGLSERSLKSWPINAASSEEWETWHEKKCALEFVAVLRLGNIVPWPESFKMVLTSYTHPPTYTSLHNHLMHFLHTHTHQPCHWLPRLYTHVSFQLQIHVQQPPHPKYPPLTPILPVWPVLVSFLDNHLPYPSP